MKKLGIVLFTAGIIIMVYAAVDFAKNTKRGSEEDVKGQPLPFPWFPTAGAVLIASGIIMMSTSGKGTKA